MGIALASSTSVGVAGGDFGSGTCARPLAECGDALSARTTSGVKSGIPVEGRVAVSNGCRGNITGDVVSRGCGVTDGGSASTDLADRSLDGGWDYLVGEGSFGRDSHASDRVVSDSGGASYNGCSNGCGGVGGLPPGVGY